jgi:hypothetical protein
VLERAVLRADQKDLARLIKKLGYREPVLLTDPVGAPPANITAVSSSSAPSDLAGVSRRLSDINESLKALVAVSQEEACSTRAVLRSVGSSISTVLQDFTASLSTRADLAGSSEGAGSDDEVARSDEGDGSQ